jgi:hypothetical protein
MPEQTVVEPYAHVYTVLDYSKADTEKITTPTGKAPAVITKVQKAGGKLIAINERRCENVAKGAQFVVESPANMPDVNFGNTDEIAPTEFWAPTNGEVRHPARMGWLYATSPKTIVAVVDEAVLEGRSSFDGVNVVKGRAVVKDARLEGKCSVEDDATINGGCHTFLKMFNKSAITGNVVTDCVKLAGNARIMGNVSVHNLHLSGNTLIDARGCVPEGEHVNVGPWFGRLINDLTEFDTLQLFGYSGEMSLENLCRIAEAVGGNLMPPDSRGENPWLREVTFCLDPEVHAQHIDRCRCALWNPLALLGNAAAIHYIVRAEGLLKPPGEAVTPYLDSSMSNPFSSFSILQLEDLMSEVYSGMYVADRYYGSSFKKDRVTEMYIENYDAFGVDIPSEDVITSKCLQQLRSIILGKPSL